MPGKYFLTLKSHPDHKGAGLFLKKLQLSPDDIIIAEDVLQQTYYFGRVHYWLRNVEDARPYVLKDEYGALYDIYTETKLIGSAEELVSLIKDYSRGDIYLVTSAETSYHSGYFLGEKIGRILNSFHKETIFTGRDSVTKVIRIPKLSLQQVTETTQVFEVKHL